MDKGPLGILKQIFFSKHSLVQGMLFVITSFVYGYMLKVFDR